MRLPLLGGAYSTRSAIAAVTRAVNLYPEINPKALTTVPVTHYSRPGLRFQVHHAANLAPVRGCWSRSDGFGGYVVIGSTVYWLSNALVLTSVGAIGSSDGPVFMTDNGVNVFLVDGTSTGYFILMNPPPGTLSTIVDSTGTFVGGTSVDTLDTFLLWGFLNSNFFGSTLAGSTTFNGLFFAAKAAYPDPLVRLIVNKREILLLGSKRSEIWYNAGGAQFPFQLLPGVYIQHGCAAVASAAYQNIEVYWLSVNEQGLGVVLMQRGYETRRISNHALEYQIRQMQAQGTLADATAFTCQFDGHVFYVLTFPTGDQTWVYDSSVTDPAQAWHQWAWTDSSGGLHRSRANCGMFLAKAVSSTGQVGVFIVGDWQNGSLYALDSNYYFDDAREDKNNVGASPSTSTNPITWIRTFEHLGMANVQGGPQPVETDGKRVLFHSFYADIDSGHVSLAADPSPQISLRWSDDRGNTWSNAILQPYGPQGHYGTWPTWRTLGISRDRVFELNFSCAGLTALNGAWVEAEVLDS